MAKKPKPPANNALQPAQSASADLSQLERMLAFMEQHGLEEIEYEHAGLRVRLRKPSTNTHHAGAAPRSFGGGALVPPEILVAGGASPAGEASAPSRAEPSGAAAAEAEDLHVVKSPIVGTFYEGPSPGAEPFVKVGDQVASGQVLCIIEAMKLMNEIESDAAGEIVRRYVENGQPVEYGESLFAIRTSRKK
ncbi:MAG: acetyl-CoA carboxylase biotin carboxyl carrier protein [Acidobacteria bacterium]|nr:acetyl-CoA carboxylase biotin carboxyl carrier protein [Acidobacteriota bacterium]MCL5287400.1 acetyl-CoA carboxylase biotin carboxyl carrier protein [Acidobacteriota bacterium]